MNPQKLAGQCGKLKCCLNYETAAYMDAQSRIPRVNNPLEFEDGLAYLMKTDILREVMYFSYDPSSLANLYPLYAEEVWDIIKMNRNGIRPESLKNDTAPAAPEFVTAVGDDAINRFDEARKRKKKKKSGNRGQHRGGENRAEAPASKDVQVTAPQAGRKSEFKDVQIQEQNVEKPRREEGGRSGQKRRHNDRRGGRRNDKPKTPKAE